MFWRWFEVILSMGAGSAYRFLTKVVLAGGVSQKFLGNHDLPKLRGNLEHGRGLGADLILDFLNGPRDEHTGERPHPIPGVNTGSVIQQLANLKASGDEGRIIQEVYAVIEAENHEKLALMAAQEAEQRRQEEEHTGAPRAHGQSPAQGRGLDGFPLAAAHIADLCYLYAPAPGKPRL